MSVAIARGQTWSCLQDHFPRHGNARAPSKGAHSNSSWRDQGCDLEKVAQRTNGNSPNSPRTPRAHLSLAKLRHDAAMDLVTT